MPQSHGLFVGGRIRLVGADNLGGHAVEIITVVGTGQPERVVDQSGLRFDVEPGKSDVQILTKPAHLVHRHFQGGRWRFAFDGADLHAVLSNLIQMNGVESCRDVRSQIGRTRYFVEQLGGDRANRYLAARAVVLSNNRRSVFGDLGPGKTNARHVGNFGEERVVAAAGRSEE